jgi:circadian clock protein KaiC
VLTDSTVEPILSVPDGDSFKQLATGVGGLDEVLGGGIPEYSFNVIAGAPGSGKTTLSQQIMFALATPQRPALHLTIVGESALKMLRYQQRFTFFDKAKVGTSIHYVHLNTAALGRGFDAIFDDIVCEVEHIGPALVVVDSFRSLMRAAAGALDGSMELQRFLERLAIYLASWQATTFLVGEHTDTGNSPEDAVFTVADGILWLHQSIERNSAVRKLQAVKMRGQAPLPGLHTMRITEAGVHVFPRIMRRTPRARDMRPSKRLSIGVPALDAMLGGGIPAWDSMLVTGPAGSGKSALATHFIAAGLAAGEHAVIAVFEEHPEDFIAHAKTIRPDLEQMLAHGLLEVIYLKPLDLSVDEALLEIRAAVERTHAQRLVIDSLSGFELALAPTFRADFRESLYRMVGALTGTGVTVFMTAEASESFADMRFSADLISFLADDVIFQRYVEMEGQMRKVMTVLKMRGSAHSKDLRLYDVTADGVVVGDTMYEYRGIVTGVARRHLSDESEQIGERAEPTDPPAALN